MSFVGRVWDGAIRKFGPGMTTHRHFRMFLAHAGSIEVGVTRNGHFEELMEFENDIERLLKLPEERIHLILQALPFSKAQNRQDIFALAATKFKRGGYFVDFGGTNGKDINNTYLLETKYDWTGIVAEPARVWHSQLRANRNCIIETACVWTKTGERLSFNESASAELSTLTKYAGQDFHTRSGMVTYDVETISLTDLLIKHDAPKVIDFLSIDTEGSEFEILNAFDFDTYSFRAIACEHNYTASRAKIAELLISKGYSRRFTGLSKWDDWYVKPGL